LLESCKTFSVPRELASRMILSEDIIHEQKPHVAFLEKGQTDVLNPA